MENEPSTSYIVFRGKPEVIYNYGPEAIRDAEHMAAQLAESFEEPFVLLKIPTEALKLGIIAEYRGVVLDALTLGE